MIKFPAKICYLNNDEVKVVKDMNDIEKYRGFVVQQVNMAWGRKPIPNNHFNGEFYENMETFRREER